MVETLLLAGLNAGVIGSAGTAVAIGQGVSLIGTAMTGLSALGAISGGNQQAAISKAQAKQYELSARQEELKGREEANKIRESLKRSLASQNAIFAARGVSLSSGTPVTLGNVSRSNASMDIDTAMFNAGQASGADRLRASQSRIEAKAYRTGGYANAAGKLYGGSDQFGSLLR